MEESVDIPISNRLIDEKEAENISRFLKDGCSCTFGPDKSQCYRQFSVTEITNRRDQINEMLSLNPSGIDFFIMGHIDSGTELGKNPVYRFKGFRVCSKFFRFLNITSQSKLDSIRNHYKVHGLFPREHGLRNKPSNNPSLRWDNEEMRNVENFIRYEILDRGIAIPGRIPYYNDWKALRFPPQDTYTSLHNKYLLLGGNINIDTFKTYWQTTCGDIGLGQKCSDLCPICTTTMYKVAKLASIENEDEREKLKREKFSEAIQHLERVDAERADFNERIKTSQQNLGKNVLLSFDYAQGKFFLLHNNIIIFLRHQW